jgi:hypothetical protein
VTTQPVQDGAAESQAAIWRQRWGLHNPATLRLRAHELGGSNCLVEGVLPARSISFVLGDSGLGKSPLAYQLGICVAAGIPYLGRPTRQSRVVIADFENGIADVLEAIDRISRYLGLPEPPADDRLLIWSVNDCFSRYGQAGHTLLDMLRDVHPGLAIIDSLGSYRPLAEDKNTGANDMLSEFRCLARDCGTATQFLHHRRKQSRKSEERAGALESADLRRWFQDSRGASALITGSDVRLGVDEPDLSAAGRDDVALVLRGFGRMRGEIGPLYVARDSGESGEPIGYRLLSGPELLFDQHKRQAFESLPQEFTFRDAKRAYGRADQATRNWLLQCIDIGLLRQSARGLYQKV